MTSEQNVRYLPNAKKKKFIILYAIAGLLMALHLNGCSLPSKPETEPASEIVDNTPTVLLNEIQPPEFRKRFAVMYCGNDMLDVRWGMTDNAITDGFFMSDSSYPGFGYTVIVQYDYFTRIDTITLCTKYGYYDYKYKTKYSVYLENNALTNRETGEKVNRLDADNELLVVYSSIDNVAYEYKLKRGTKIAIE